MATRQAHGTGRSGAGGGKPLGRIMSMIYAELITEYTRTIEVEGEIHLQVAVVDWPGPGSPTMVWKTFRRWRKPPTPERLAAAQQQALTMPRYFRVCQRCGERNNAGHMHDHEICQTCAERYLGVVY